MIIKEITENKLRLRATKADEVIGIVWEGKSQDREPGIFLRPFLESMMDQALSSGSSIELDFRELQYMNSSTITPLVQMLEAARERSLSITVLYAAGKSWQEVSFSALRIFESDDPPIRIVGVDS